MDKQHSPISVLVRSAFGLILLGLLASGSAAYAQGNSAIQAPRLELTKFNFANPLFNFTAPFDDPEAEYQGGRVVHNVTVGGQKGMRVHAKFRVMYGLGVPCRMIAYFYQGETPIEANDPKYTNAEGGVSAHTDFTPAYDPAVYNDLQIFVPYSALNLEESGEYDLRFYLSLYDKSGKRFFGKSGWYNFTMTMP
jgi:hypothetical protein